MKEKLDVLDGSIHGFYGRQGGVSTGLRSSLNFSFKGPETINNIRENRHIVLSDLRVPQYHFLTMNQKHGKRVFDVRDKLWLFGDDACCPEADAMITNRRDVVLGVMTADCVPLLMYSPSRQVVAAVHAGWRGVAAGIIEEICQSFQTYDVHSEDIHVGIGPSIFQENYEVGAEVIEQFKTYEQCYFKSLGNVNCFLFDLRGLVKQQLNNCGIVKIEEVKKDTYKDQSHYFSCRRAAHKKEPGFGCMISTIGLQGTI